MEIASKFNFSKQMSDVCKKINNQFNVMLRFRKLMRRDTLLKLYKAYILPHFFSYFEKNSSYVSGVNVCIFVALYLCNFVRSDVCCKSQ